MNYLIKTSRIINFKDLTDHRGGLGVIEKNIPFEIKRIYFLHHIKNNQVRGAHAHKELEQVIVAISGSFEITIDDGFNKLTRRLDNPNEGLYMCPMLWRDIAKFSSDAVCLVLASDIYKESDYIREYEEFKHAIHEI
jgi:hypothetical protein